MLRGSPILRKSKTASERTGQITEFVAMPCVPGVFHKIQRVDTLCATSPSMLNNHSKWNVSIISLWEEKSAKAEEPLGFDQG
jgi:hypothetical protein